MDCVAQGIPHSEVSDRTDLPGPAKRSPAFLIELTPLKSSSTRGFPSPATIDRVKSSAMDPTVIREEVQAFLQVCHGFAGFVRHYGLTTAEREALANVGRTLGLNFKPSTDDPPLATTFSNFPPID